MDLATRQDKFGTPSMMYKNGGNMKTIHDNSIVTSYGRCWTQLVGVFSLQRWDDNFLTHNIVTVICGG